MHNTHNFIKYSTKAPNVLWNLLMRKIKLDKIK